MSSKIYFKDNNKNLLRPIVRAITESYRKIYPAGAHRQFRKLLTSPQKPKPVTIPDGISAKAMETQYGDLMTYSIGSGPTVLFVHGWSGSGSQFFSLMQALAKQGYRALSYDHYRHGLSTGKECNYPLFIHSLDILAQQCYDLNSLACVVSHSMGSTACLDFFKERSIPHFLIAPILDFYNEMYARISDIGISQEFLEAIITSVENDYNMSVKNLDSMEHVSLIKNPIGIIHSESDKFALHHFSQSLADQYDNIHLRSISASDNIGHMRIVAIPETEATLSNFLKDLY